MLRQSKKRKKAKQINNDKRNLSNSKKKRIEFDIECDETFAYIVGYTESGMPFGITYEEMEQIEELDEISDVRQSKSSNSEV